MRLGLCGLAKGAAGGVLLHLQREACRSCLCPARSSVSARDSVCQYGFKALAYLCHGGLLSYLCLAKGVAWLGSTGTLRPAHTHVCPSVRLSVCLSVPDLQVAQLQLPVDRCLSERVCVDRCLSEAASSL